MKNVNFDTIKYNKFVGVDSKIINKIKTDDIKNTMDLKSKEFSNNIYKNNILGNWELNNTKKPNFIINYSSLEILPYKAVKLAKILKYIITSETFNLTEKELKRYTKAWSKLNQILNGLDQTNHQYLIVQDELQIIIQNSYGFTKNHSLGRLYPLKASINQLPKELHYLLYNGLVKNIDIVNAHPSILFQYAILNGILTSSLKLLVSNRDLFYKKVLEQLNISTTDKTEAKKHTIIALNVTEKNFNSKLLNELVGELILIRKSIYEKNYLKNSDFKSAINFRIEIAEKTLKVKLSLEQIYLKCQSLYCLNQETLNILKLKTYIESLTNDTLSIVPFYDGFFIKSIEGNFSTGNLQSAIDRFNATNIIKFKIKPIEPFTDLLTEELLNELLDVFEALDNIKPTEIKQLIEKNELESHIDLPDGNECEKDNSITFGSGDIKKLQNQYYLKRAKIIDCFRRHLLESKKTPKN